jgi:hypothetical protein
MMTKLAIIVMADTDTAEGMGRVANAFMLLSEAIEANAEYKFIFEGAGTKWIGALEEESHKLHGMYIGLKQHITGVCSFCASAFGVKSGVEKAGVNLIAEYNQHPSLLSLVNEGYQIVTF